MTFATEMELLTATKKQLESWAAVIGGKAWGADKGKPRIYMPSFKDRKIYFAFDDFPTGDDLNLLGGAALKVFIDDCGQAPQWYASQRKREMTAVTTAALALEALDHGETDLAATIMDLDDTPGDAAIDAFSDHITNGRLAEARQALGL